MSIKVKRAISLSALKKDVPKDYPHAKHDKARNLLIYGEGDAIEDPTPKERALITAANDAIGGKSKTTVDAPEPETTSKKGGKS